MQAPVLAGDATPYVSIRIRAPRHDRPLVDGAFFDTGDWIRSSRAEREQPAAPTNDKPKRTRKKPDPA